jgi:restriction endonuclease S subunit
MIEECWHQMIQGYSIKLEEIQQLENQCHELVLAYLGITKLHPIKIGKLFLLHLAKAERWSFEYNKRVLSGLAQIRAGIYKAYPLSDLCQGQSGSTPSKKNPSFWENGEFPWVSPKDMKMRFITDSQDHISLSAVEHDASPIVKKGSILFVVRSGILQRKVPVAMTLVDVSINQDIRAFTPRTDDILPEFLLTYFETKQDDLLRLVKWSTTVQSINKEGLEDFPIPLPPKDIQEEIVMAVAEIHNKIENLKKESDYIHQNAERKIEDMILGIRPVEGT